MHHLIFMYLDKSWIHENTTWFSCTLIIAVQMLLSYFITWFSCTLISHEFMNSWKHHLIFMYLDKSWIHEFMNSWKHENILLYFYFTYITQYHIDSTSVASKLSEEEDLEISTWQDYRTSLELVTEITVQIQDKFKLVIQGALR